MSGFLKEEGRVLGSTLALLAFLLLLLLGAAYTFGYVVKPGEMGVRKIGFGPGEGFHDEALEPGYHWGVPFLGYSVVYNIPRTVRTLHFHRDTKNYPQSFGPLDVATDKDRNKVILDVSVLTRFYSTPGKTKISNCDSGEGSLELVHGGPADLLRQVGISPEDWDQRIRTSAGDELRRALGRLSGTDFYNPILREARVCDARLAMNKALARFGIRVEDVLLRRYTYEAESIDEAIFLKNLQDQEKRLNNTLKELAKVQAELQKTEANWDARIKPLRTEGESQVQIIRSEGELYEEKRRSEGDLLVDTARAKSQELQASALARSSGGKIFVAQELARILRSLEGGVVSDVNPYDVDAWVEKLGGADKEEGR